MQICISVLPMSLSVLIFIYGVISILPTLGIGRRKKMQRYYVPYRSLNPCVVHGVDLFAHADQTSIHEELGGIAHPLIATVVL